MSTLTLYSSLFIFSSLLFRSLIFPFEFSSNFLQINCSLYIDIILKFIHFSSKFLQINTSVYINIILKFIHSFYQTETISSAGHGIIARLVMKTWRTKHRSGSVNARIVSTKCYEKNYVNNLPFKYLSYYITVIPPCYRSYWWYDGPFGPQKSTDWTAYSRWQARPN